MATSMTRAHGDLSLLLETGDFSDLMISCGEEKFKAHKKILCLKSPVIKAALTGDWKEKNTGVDAPTIWRFLRFCYGGKYDEGDNGPVESEPPVMPYELAKVNVDMVAMADFYQVDSLKRLARTRFGACSLDWDKAAFLKLAQAVYNSTPDSESVLRETLCDLAAAHVGELCGDADSRKAIMSLPALALDLLLASVTKKVRPSEDESQHGSSSRSKAETFSLTYYCPGRRGRVRRELTIKKTATFGDLLQRLIRLTGYGDHSVIGIYTSQHTEIYIFDVKRCTEASLWPLLDGHYIVVYP